MLNSDSIQTRPSSNLDLLANYLSPTKIRKHGKKQLLFGVLLLFGGLLATLILSITIFNNFNKNSKTEFDFAGKLLKTKISTRLFAHAQLLRSQATLFENPSGVSRDIWQKAYNHLKIEKNLPGILGIGYAVTLTPDEVNAHEKEIQNQGFPSYSIYPKGKREIYSAIIYLEPFSDRNLRAFGFDMFSEPVRRAAMQKARDNDIAALTGKITLVQETDTDIQAGTLMYVPVYKSGMASETIDERRKALQGWVYSPYRMNDLLVGILGNYDTLKGKNISLEIYDDPSYSKESLLYDSRKIDKAQTKATEIFSKRTSISFNDHKWYLQLREYHSDSSDNNFNAVWYIATGGVGISFLIFFLYISLIATKKVEVELKESESSLSTLMSNIPGMAYRCKNDLDYTMQFVSDGCKELTGYRAEELVNNQKISYANLIIDNFIPIISGKIKNALEKNEHFELEYQIITADGSKKWVWERGIQISEEEGILEGVIHDITDRKIMEISLRESELRFKDVAHATGDWIWEINNEGLYTFSSDACTNILGYKPKELVGKKYFYDFFDEAGKEQIARIAFEGISKKETLKSFELVVIHKNGSRVYVSKSGMPIYDDIGNMIGYRGADKDITKRKIAESTTQESEQKFRSLFENHSAVKLLIDPKTSEIIDANKSASEFYGWKIDELKAMKISEINTLSTDEIQNEMQKVVSKKREYFNFKHRLANGNIRDVEVFSSTISFVGKNLLHSIIHDVTERKLAERELEKRSLAIEQSSASIVITDLDGNIEYVNPKFTQVTGFSFEEAINNNSRILKSGEQATEFYKELWDTLLIGETWRGVFHNQHKNGELFWESAIISPVKDENGVITNFVAIKEDITEKKAMLEELIRSKEKAENADKMKSIFLAQMSHEIRTPINALVSMASLLRYDFEEGADEDQLMSFDVIDRAGGRIIRTVDLLLNLSEIQAGTYEIITTQFDVLSDVIAIIMAEYKKTAAKKNIIIEIDSNMVDNELVADSYTVNQIFTQLIDNAIKYTEEGEVTIKTLRNELDQLVVEIKDTGIGIAEDYLPNLFKPFSQEEMGYTRKFEGNGIGMALVSKYCELNNAKIEVESKKGVGSTFRVVFN